MRNTDDNGEQRMFDPCDESGHGSIDRRAFFAGALGGAALATVHHAAATDSKFRDWMSVKDFGAFGNGAMDDTTAINNALTQIKALGGGTLYFPPGIYKTTSTITLAGAAVGIRIVGSGHGNGSSNGSIIQYVGASGGDTAVFRATGDDGFMANAIENISLDANSRAGYCLHLDAWRAGVTKVSKHWRLERVEFSYPTRAHVLLGQNTFSASDFSAATIDLDAHMNVFEHCVFTCMPSTKWGVVINVADNAYQTVLRDCSWEGSASQRAGMINYVRQRSGNSLELYNVFFPPLPSLDANVACVRQHAGSVLMVGCESEEGRVVKRESIGTAYGHLTMIDVKVNDASDLSGTAKRAINDASTFPITLINCRFDTGAFGRVISSRAPIVASGVINSTWAVSEAATSATALKLTQGLYERARAVPVGEWTSVPFTAGNFTGSGSMRWIVESENVTTYAYARIGKTMTVVFHIATSTVGGTPSTQLRIAIPGGHTAIKRARAWSQNYNNSTNTASFCEVIAGGTTINIYKDLSSTTTWTGETHLTAVYGQITFEIN